MVAPSVSVKDRTVVGPAEQVFERTDLHTGVYGARKPM